VVVVVAEEEEAVVVVVVVVEQGIEIRNHTDAVCRTKNR
jgi:hypothetical protein